MFGKVFQHGSCKAGLDAASLGGDDPKDAIPDLETTLKGLQPMKRVTLALTLALAAGLSAQAADAQTLKTIKDRGMLSCGVSQGLPGFSSPDDKGNWTGLDVDLCRAIAGAIFNDATKVKYVPLSAKDRFTALQSGEIDVLSRNTTWTISRDTSLGANFTGVTYYDGQGFMVKKSLKVNSALELNSASVCVQTGTTTEQNLADYFKANNMKYEVIAFGTNDETVKAYEAGRCDVFTTDQSGLYANRLKLANPNDHMVLPEIISKEPLGPMVRHGDDQWFDIVKWTLFALVTTEELGVTSKNVDEKAKLENPELKRVLGSDGNFGEQLGLTKDWVVRIVKAVGNYGEVFDRNVGAGSPLGINRGLNNLWNKGGLQYAPPIR
ncbi:General L-amino acid-binding protein periplasmic protein aapJ [Bradyrhizobium japonicum SEMIA 5079]|nr:General L-amino acid-binding protein periplasmic protein aapJ [Bradyrhizobium japonicum SEMIA 5079]